CWTFYVTPTIMTNCVIIYRCDKNCQPLLTGAEQPVPRIAQPGQDVALRVQLAVERRGEHRDVAVGLEHAAHALGSGDQAEEPDALRAGVLERAHGVH